MDEHEKKQMENYEQVSQMADVDWIKNSTTKGKLWIDDKIHVEFNFKGIPKFKVYPKESRKALPRITDLIPECVLWDEETIPPWREILETIKNKLLEILALGDVSANTMKRKTIHGLLQVAKENHPNECFFLLRKDARGIISEAILPQGAKGGKTMAIFLPSRVPFDRSLVGTFHSHPSGSGQASTQDLDAFRRYPVNIIAYPPFSGNSFKVYDARGGAAQLEFVD